MLSFNRKGTFEVDSYCYEHYVTQHDLLRELAIYRSEKEPIEQRKRLIMDISKNRYPQWLVEQQQQPKHAHLLSISTGIQLFMNPHFKCLILLGEFDWFS